jgi:cytochrome b6-f complex iron-sulfur subunit
MSELTPALSGACASCISRRAFLADSAALAAVAALFAACGGEGGITPPAGKVDIKVGDFPGLATNGTLVLVDSRRAAKRTGATTFVAWSRLCTHEGTPVDLTGNAFVCANHGSRFDANGDVTLGPATQALGQLATSYDAASDTLTIGT